MKIQTTIRDLLLSSSILGAITSYTPNVFATSLKCKPIQQIESFEIISNINRNQEKSSSTIPVRSRQLILKTDGETEQGSQNRWDRVSIDGSDEWVSHQAVSAVFLKEDNQPTYSSSIFVQSKQSTTVAQQANLNSFPKKEPLNSRNSSQESLLFGFLSASKLDWNILQLLTLIAIIYVGILNQLYHKARKREIGKMWSHINSQVGRAITLEQLERSLQAAIRASNHQNQQDLKTQTETLLMAINKAFHESQNLIPKDLPSNLVGATGDLYSNRSISIPTSLLQQVIASFGKTDQLFSDQRFSAVGFPTGFVPSSLMCDSLGRPAAKLVPSISINTLFLKFEESGSIFLIPNVFLNNLSGKIAQSQASFELFFEIIGAPTSMAKIELEHPAEIELNGSDDCSILRKGRLIFS